VSQTVGKIIKVWSVKLTNYYNYQSTARRKNQGSNLEKQAERGAKFDASSAVSDHGAHTGLTHTGGSISGREQQARTHIFYMVK
jgi:hypothetical protein